MNPNLQSEFHSTRFLRDKLHTGSGDPCSLQADIEHGSNRVSNQRIDMVRGLKPLEIEREKRSSLLKGWSAAEGWKLLVKKDLLRLRITTFFNSLRMKSSANQSAATEPNGATSTNSVEEVTSLSSNQEDSSLLSRGLSSSVDDSREPMEFDDDLNDDEKAFLESLGWEKDVQVEVLTAEDIDAFVKEHGRVRQSSRLSHHDLGTTKTNAAT